MVKCLIYCTKAKPYLFGHYVGFDTKYQYNLTKCKQVFSYHNNVLNGKIVAQFNCEKVEEIYNERLSNGVGYDNFFYTEELDSLFQQTQLDNYELENYLGSKGKGEKVGYAIHISNLEIFDEPKELAKHTLDNNSDFYIKKWIKKFDSFKGSALTKAPQNMCNVYDRQLNHYILISIKPEWVEKILNGEKTIEVRRVVVNQLKNLIGV